MTLCVKSIGLGYVHWPELSRISFCTVLESIGLGYVHWPELIGGAVCLVIESIGLGYVHWPERVTGDLERAEWTSAVLPWLVVGTGPHFGEVFGRIQGWATILG